MRKRVGLAAHRTCRTFAPAALLTAATLAGGCAARTAPPRATVFAPPRDVPALLVQLHAADRGARLRAAFFLAAFNRSAAGVPEALGAALEDPSADVREVAFWGLQPANDPAQTASAREYDQPPRARHLTKPVYPNDAFQKRVEGVVEVEFLIGRDGRVVYAYVMRGIEDLDPAAVRTVAQWTFEPARRGGQAVPTIARAPVTFRIY